MSPQPRPTVFLAITNPDWISPARAPKALRQAGFRVVVHCPRGHPVERSRFVDSLIAYDLPIGAIDYVRAVAAALDAHRPALVLPGDDVALGLLHRMRQAVRPDHAARAVLDASLAPLALQDAAERKSRQVLLAREIGLEVAPSLVDPAPEAAVALAERVGYPVLVKLDFSWAGEGVAVCADRAALLAALAAQPRPLPFRAAASRTVQAFVPGRDVFVTQATRDGVVLAGFAMEKLARVALGPATAARRLEDEAPLLEAAAALAGRLRLSGIGDVEFRLDARTGRPVFIEANPRLVPIAHLGARLGADVFGALARSFGGQPAAAPRPPLDGPIALFPGEWRRDPASPYIRDGFHDAPWDEPELMPEDFAATL
jgi:carbamoylphosphate synthase large subunit